MKKYFYLMSLMVGLLVCSFGFVACGDDDDDNGNGGVITTGKYAGNRLVGEWIWGEPNMSQEQGHHAAGYIFNADGTCKYYSRHTDEGESWEEQRIGTFVLNKLNLTISWTKMVMKENGKTFEEPMDSVYVDQCEIMYPESGDVGMFLKRYYDTGSGQGWSEEGPFYKKGSTTTPTTQDATITEDKLKGLWYAVDENSANKINVFMVNFMSGGQGYYAELKAKAKHNWEPEQESAPMTWQLDKNTVKFYVIIDQERMERKADILKLTDNEVTIKRYLDEGTDQITMKRAQNEQEVVMYFSQLVAEKTK